MEDKKEEVLCDFTTGVCGPADGNNGIMEFVDLSKDEEETGSENKKEEQ